MRVQGKVGSGLFVFLLALASGGAMALAAAPNSSMAGAAARSTHSSQALPAALRPVFYHALARDAGAAYNINKQGCAVLPKQPLKGCFDGNGAHFTGTGSPLALRLTAWGRGNDLTSVTAVRPAINHDEASYLRGDLTEWWRVLPLGFEQGFTIAKRPGGHGELTLALNASGQDARAPNKGTLAWGKLRYGDLVVTDARGKVVPATMTTIGNQVRIAVNDAHAAYPLTVDPLLWLEQEVTASDGAAGDEFGNSVAISGTTALVGAPQQLFGSGKAYIFGESGGTWTQTAELTASDGATGDEFGTSVALAGTTALVGAPQHNDFHGAAYVFDESGGAWTQTAELTASDGALDDEFGFSVALAGTTALVGALGHNNNQGAAYVFYESGGAWFQTAELTASDGAAGDLFGWSVALAGTIALVGAAEHNNMGNPEQGAAYVFDESVGWTQTAELLASDGTAGDYFGTSVALAGTTALVGAPLHIGQGAAYVFDESGGTWTQTAELTASDGAVGAQFGLSVALAGTTALVGASERNNFQGAAYVFSESGGSWTQTAELVASDGAAYDEFGNSVALAGTTALVGAPGSNNSQGAAYFFSQSDLGLSVSAPPSVEQGQPYTSQTVATNNASAASPAVTVTVSVPAAASFISAAATQGSCNEAAGVVTCDLGAINGNAGTATAYVTLKATGNVGTTIDNTANVALATPPLTASAPTGITTSCPAGYTGYSGSLSSGEHIVALAYRAPAGGENAILTAPSGFLLQLLLQDAEGWHKYAFLSNAVHRRGPSGTYAWGVKANATGGAYTLCILHP